MKMTLHTILLATAALGLSAAAAQAQSYGVAYRPQPLYPYVVQPQAYAYPPQQPQYAPRAYPYVRPNSGPAILHQRSKVDPALIEELRRGRRHKKIDRTIVVREKPIVVEHHRVVDDPPIVIKRHHVVDVPARAMRRGRAHASAEAPRTIRAEAEVTIIGPDRMSIRLFRKPGAPAPDIMTD